uniref:PspC domain-containing protein n=1 Tax=Paenibacillus durus TaxID=44251 RepID=UPI000470C1E6
MTRLYRSTRDKVLTGLTGGLAESVGIDSTLLRILLLISIPFTGGAVIPVYFIAALIIPKEPGPYPPYGFGPEMAGGG